MWYFAHCDLTSPELISTLASRADPFLAAQPQWLRLAVLSSPPWSVNVIRVIHLTPSLVWLNYLAFLWTAKLIPCDFNKLRAEGEHPSEGGQWLLFSDASLMNVSGRLPQKKQEIGGGGWGQPSCRRYWVEKSTALGRSSSLEGEANVAPVLAFILAPGRPRWMLWAVKWWSRANGSVFRDRSVSTPHRRAALCRHLVPIALTKAEDPARETKEPKWAPF